MFPEAVEEEPKAVGSSSVVPAGTGPGTDQLDLEAAEQLIQLSGGDDAGSESRSADSVKCRGKDNKEEEEEEEAAAVESRRRSAGRFLAAGKDGKGNGNGSDSKAVDSLSCNARAADHMVDKDDKAVVVSSAERERFPAAGKDRGGGIIIHGEARRQRFRSLAAIYRETEPRCPAGGREGHADRRGPLEDEGERKTEKKRAADEVIPVDAEATEARRSVQLARTRL